MAHFLIISDGTFSLMYDYNTENHLYFYRIDRNALIMDFNQQYIMYKLIERMILKDDVNIDLSNKKMFVCFGLSFLVKSFGWTEQGKAFFYINIGAVGLLIAVFILIVLFMGSGALEKLGISIVLVIFSAIIIGITLFATWGATKLFDVDFYVAFQIMGFGQCLCTSNKKIKSKLDKSANFDQL